MFSLQVIEDLELHVIEGECLAILAECGWSGCIGIGQMEVEHMCLNTICAVNDLETQVYSL